MSYDLTNLFQLLTAEISCNSCFSRHYCQNLMLEAFSDKTCLAKCSGNCLEMHFEYSHVSVAQKLTELRIFGCQRNWGHLLVMAAV